MKNYIPNRTIEYNDNRISRFIAQYGKCAISGIELGKSDWHCHHKNLIICQKMIGIQI